MDAWLEHGVDFGPMPYIKYSRGGSNAQHTDTYFYKFLQERYLNEDIDQKFKTYRYGRPKQDAAFKSVLKYKSPLTPPRRDVLEVVKGWLGRHFFAMNDCASDFDWEHIVQSMNKGSSPGFPFTRPLGGVSGFATKRALFAHDGGNYAINLFDQYLKMMKVWPAPQVEFYVLSAKHEMRKVSKILANDFRTYTAASWRNTALGTAIFGPMLEVYYSLSDSTWSYVGGSMYFGQWNELFQRLNKHPNAFECDESAFDSTIHRDFVMAVKDVLMEFHQDKSTENTIMIDNLFEFIVEGMVLCPNGDIFYKTQGNPSGSFLTVVLNTLVLYMLLAYAWVQLVPEEMRTYECFHDNVEAALYGDDNLWTVSDFAKQWFNASAVARVWQGLGIIINQEKYKEGKLCDLHFLSASFQYFEGAGYVPVLDLEKSICSQLYHSLAYRSVKWSYLKASSLLLNVYWNPEGRALFKDYRVWLIRRYKAELMAEPSMKQDDILHWRDLENLNLLDSAIMQMFTCSETSSANKKIIWFVNFLQDAETYIEKV